MNQGKKIESLSMRAVSNLFPIFSFVSILKFLVDLKNVEVRLIESDDETNDNNHIMPKKKKIIISDDE